MVEGPVEAGEAPTASAPTQLEPGADETAEGGHLHLPPASIWPVTSAFGVALIGFGLVTLTLFSAVGVLVAAYAIYSWVQELRDAEPH